MLDKEVLESAIASVGNIKELRRHVQLLWVSIDTCGLNHCRMLAIIDGFILQDDEELTKEASETVVRRLKEISQQVCTDEQLRSTREEFIKLGYNPLAWMKHITPEQMKELKEIIDLDDAS